MSENNGKPAVAETVRYVILPVYDVLSDMNTGQLMEVKQRVDAYQERVLYELRKKNQR